MLKMQTVESFSATSPIIVFPDEGQTLEAFGDTAQVLHWPGWSGPDARRSPAACLEPTK